MNKTDFNLIMNSLEARTAECSKHLDNIRTTDDIKQLTIQQAIDLKQFCSEEEAVMTKIAMVDLYHIIGMGDLTPIQMSQFIFRIKDYLQYRPNIKSIATHLDSISDLPKIPAATRYRLLGLCELTLRSDFEVDDEIEDISMVADYDNLKVIPAANAADPSDDSFTLNGNVINLNMNKINQFVTAYKKVFKTNISANNLKQKIKGNHSYGGIKWVSSNANEAYGVVNTEFLPKLAAYRNSADQ